MITMPKMIPSVVVKIANKMKLIGKLLKKSDEGLSFACLNATNFYLSNARNFFKISAADQD